MVSEGALTLAAGSGIVIQDSLNGQNSGNAIVIDADFESAGDGTLTVQAGKMVTSTNGDTTITAWDLDLDGSINTGSAAVTIHGAQISQTIGLGASVANMTITDEELGRVEANGGLTIGSSTTGDIIVHNITEANSDVIGRLTLVATKEGGTVTFLGDDFGSSTFNKGITVQVMAGAIISGTLVTSSSNTVFSTGTGTLTVVAGEALSTTGQLLTVTADDMDLAGALSSGVAAIDVTCFTPDTTVGLGAGVGQFSVTAAEFQQITATGMSIGGPQCGSQNLDGVDNTNSAGISEVLTVVASRDDCEIKFSGTSSTFNALSVQADNGIAGQADITTTGGILYLDGDIENSSSADSLASIRFAVNSTFKAQTTMTLEVTTGSMMAQGALTLFAGSGIVIEDNLFGMDVGSPLVIDADHNDNSDGTLTVVTGKTVDSNNGDITVTAWDIDLAGTLDAGSAKMFVHAHPNQTIGVGANRDMYITDAELGRMSTDAGLTFGSDVTGEITADGITDTNSDSVGTITLVAVAAGYDKVTFGSTGSSFNKGITVQSGGGISVEGQFTSKASAVVMNAGTGTLTVQNSLAIVTTGQLLTITTDDLDLVGEVSSGTGAIHIECTTFNRTVGLGAGAGDISFTALEFQHITSTGMSLGGPQCGLVTVDGVRATDTVGISEVFTILASRDDTSVVVSGSSSTFNALSIQADNGIMAQADLSATGGIIYLDGDYENSSSADSITTITFGSNVTISASGMLTLEDTTGSMEAQGGLTLFAGQGVIILDNLTGMAKGHAFVISCDSDAYFDGNLIVHQGKTVTSNDGDITITAWDLELDGSIDAGTQSIVQHGSQPTMTIGLGASNEYMHITDGELGRMSATGGFTLGSSTSGHMTVDGITESNSTTIGTLTLIATKTGRIISFEQQPSNFNKGITVQAMGGVVLSENVTTRASPTVVSTGTGTLTIEAGDMLSTTDQLLVITADDIVLPGSLTSGTMTTSIDCTTTDRQVGLGSGSGQLLITGDEMQRMASTGLAIGESQCGSQSVIGITADHSNNIEAIVTLVANQDDTMIQFTSAPSTFGSLSVQADNRVTIFADLTTTTGNLYLDGDVENSSSADSANRISTNTGATLTAKIMMTLEATQGTFFTNGAVTLRAGQGITFLDNLQDFSSGGVAGHTVIMHADFESAGDGILTVQTGKIISSANGPLVITAWDIDLDGSFGVGTGPSVIHGAQGSQTIGLGDTAANMHIEDAELGRISAIGGVTLGSSLSGSIVVVNVTLDNSDSVGTLTLIATQALQTVSFVTEPSSFSNGINVLAMGGVIISQNTTTQSTASVVSTGTGTLTVQTGKLLSTTGQLLTVTADDIILEGTVSSGNAALIVECFSGDRTLGLGAAVGQLSVDTDELQRITATGMSVGGSMCGTITVDGVADINSAGIGEVLTVVASRDDIGVDISGTSSTFNALSVQADSGITAQTKITTTGGIIYLDGDYENSSTDDSVSTIVWSADVTFQAQTMMTLESTTGSMHSLGALTLAAGAGIAFLDNFKGIAAGHALVIDTDFDRTSDGTITVQTGKTVASNDGAITITTWDVDFDGMIDADTETMVIHGAYASQTIGIGTSKNMKMEIAELGSLTSAGGLTVGSSFTGSIALNGATEAETDTIGTFTLIATKASSTVNFNPAASTFNKGIVVQAIGGVVVSTSVTTKASQSVISAGTGTLMIVPSEVLSTSNQLLTVTTDDVHLQGSIDSGAGAIIMECTSANQTLVWEPGLDNCQ